MVRLTGTFRSDQVRRFVVAAHLDTSVRIAVALIPPARDRAIVERFAGADWLLRDKVLRFLAAHNAAGYGVYATPNPLADGSRRRSKSTVKHVSSVWLDLDQGAGATLQRLTGELPAATTIVRTSPDKYQVLWRLAAPVDVGEGERILRGLAAACGGDRAATDACRLLRLPGFANTKYPDLPLSRRIVEVVGGTGAAVAIRAFGRVVRDGQVARPPRQDLSDVSDIPAGSAEQESNASPPAEIAADAELVRLWRGFGRTGWGQQRSASERDLALAHGLHRLGVEAPRASQILRTSPNRKSGRTKHDLGRYLSVALMRAGY